MKGASSLVWIVLIGGVLLGFGALYSMRTYYGPGGPREGLAIFERARSLDRKAMSRLEDLGLRFVPESSREPTLDLEQPTDADFRFLESVLASNNPAARVSAAKVLRDIGNPRSIEPLIAAIRGIDQEDRFMLECALSVVNRSTQEARIAALVPAWEKHREDLSGFAEEALRLKLRDVGALEREFLEKTALSHSNPEFRRFAVRELAGATPLPAGVLAAALADADPSVRSLAGTALDRVLPEDGARP